MKSSTDYFKGGNKQTISFRRQRLDIDCMLPESSVNSANSNHLALSSDPYIIDMVKLADDRISQLQHDLDNLKQSHEISETKVSNFKNQVRICLNLFSYYDNLDLFFFI